MNHAADAAFHTTCKHHVQIRRNRFFRQVGAQQPFVWQYQHSVPGTPMCHAQPFGDTGLTKSCKVNVGAPHVQIAGDIWWRHHDGEGLSILGRMRNVTRQPLIIPARLNGSWIISLGRSGSVMADAGLKQMSKSKILHYVRLYRQACNVSSGGLWGLFINLSCNRNINGGQPARTISARSTTWAPFTH